MCTFGPRGHSFLRSIVIGTSHWLAAVAILAILAPPATHAAENHYSYLFGLGSCPFGWTCAGATCSCTGSAFRIQPTSSTPQTRTPTIAFAPTSTDYIRCDIKSSNASDQMHIYYSNSAHGFSESFTKIYTLRNDGVSHYCTIPLSGSHPDPQLQGIPGWASDGAITQIRLDPGRSSSGAVEYAFVVIRQDGANPYAPVFDGVSPSGWTNGTITVTAHGDDPKPTYSNDTNPDLYGSGVFDFAYRIDGGAESAWIQYTNGYDLIHGTAYLTLTFGSGSLSTGAHTLSLRSRDRCGRTGPSATTTIYYDGAGPGVPTITGVSPGGWTNANSFTFSWTNPGDAHSGVNRYQWRVDGGGWSDHGGNAITIGAPSAGGHTFEIRAVDNVGNVGGPAGASFYYDPVAPGTPTITGVSPGGWTNTNSFTFSWTNPGDAHSGVNRYQWRVDGGGWSDHGGNAITIGAPSAGGHTFEVRAIDNAGNGGSPAGAPFYYDPVAPSVPGGLRATPANCTKTNDFTFCWNAASDAHSGVSGYQCRINGGNIVECQSTCCEVIAPLTGANTFEVRSKDVAGNVSGWAAIVFFYRSPHVVTSSAGPHGTISPNGPTTVTCSDDLTFTITPEPGFEVTALTVDGGPVPPAGSYTFSNIQADHTIVASFSDVTAPDVQVLHPNGGESLVAGTTETLRWSATDEAAVTGVDLQLSRSGPTGPFSTLATGIPNSGAHEWMVTGPASSDCYLKVVARDDIGNAGEDLSDMAFAITVVRDSIVWCREQRITHDPQHSWKPDLAVAASGVHVVWSEGDGSGSDWSVRYSVGTAHWPDDTLTWTPAVALSNAPSSHSPRVAVDGSGTVHVAWVHDGEPMNESLLYLGWSNGWGATQVLRTGEATARDPALVVGGSSVHLTWSEELLGQGTIYYARWSPIPPVTWVIGETVSQGGSRSYPDIAADAQGGLHAVWLGDAGSGLGVYYGHRAWAGTWEAESPVGTPPLANAPPAVAADVMGRVHVVWSDSSSGHTEVYCRSGDGTTWDPPFAVSPLDGNNSTAPDVGVDGAGRVHVVWSDTRDGNAEIYHRIWDGAWLPAVRVTDAAGSAAVPRIVCEGDCLYLAWSDDRDGDPEVYWRKGTVCPNGDCQTQPTPALASLAESRVEGGRVLLRWFVSGAELTSVAVHRKSPDTDWLKLGDRSPDGAGYVAFEDDGVAAGHRYGYRLGLPTAQGETLAGETWVDVPTLDFSLQGARPNPAKGGVLAVHFTLPSVAPASLALYDVSGRQVQKVEVGALGPGAHVVELRPPVTLAAGVYLLRLTQGPRVLTERVALVK